MSFKWESCKKCKSKDIVKNGNQDEVQRYKCKTCGSVFRGKDAKYSSEFKLEAIMMYINSMGIRAIARVKKVHNSVVSLWIKQMGEVVKSAFHEKINEIQPSHINILELDELFTYVKKKKIRRIYLVLSTETALELLISK
jgi:transposase-like protein